MKFGLKWLFDRDDRATELGRRIRRDRDWLRHCIDAGAEWRGPRCAECGRPLLGPYTMRVSPRVIDMVCLDGCRKEAS